jgi:hypothetical protein
MTESQAHWGFVIDSELLEDARVTLEEIRSAKAGSSSLNTKAADIVSRLTAHGLKQYYHKPTEIVPLPKMIKKTADTGINVVMGAINMVIKQFFKKRSHEELVLLGRYLEAMLWEHPEQGQPYLIFTIPGDLKDRAMVLIQRARTDQNTQDYIADVVNALTELVEHGVVHYYEKPTQMVELGGITRKTADMGINTAQKGIRRLIEKLVTELSYPQLKELSFHIESMIHDHESFKG